MFFVSGSGFGYLVFWRGIGGRSSRRRRRRKGNLCLWMEDRCDGTIEFCEV